VLCLLFNKRISSQFELDLSKLDLSRIKKTLKGDVCFSSYSIYNLSIDQWGIGGSLGKYLYEDKFRTNIDVLYFPLKVEENFDEMYYSFGLDYKITTLKSLKFYVHGGYIGTIWFDAGRKKYSGLALGTKVNITMTKQSPFSLTSTYLFNSIHVEHMISIGMEWKFLNKKQ
jgi:hypothetical protein